MKRWLGRVVCVALLLGATGCGGGAKPGTLAYLEAQYGKLPGGATKAETRKIMGEPDVEADDELRYKAADGEMSIYFKSGFLTDHKQHPKGAGKK